MKTEDNLRKASKDTSPQTTSQPKAREVSEEKRVLPTIKLNGVSIKPPRDQEGSSPKPNGEDSRRKKRPYGRGQATAPSGSHIVVVTEETSGQYGQTRDTKSLAVVGHSQQKKDRVETHKPRDKTKKLPLTVVDARCPMKPDGTAIQPLPPIQGNKAAIMHAANVSSVLAEHNQQSSSPFIIPVRHTKKSAQMFNIMLTKKAEDKKREEEELAKLATPRENALSRSNSKASTQSAKTRTQKETTNKEPTTILTESKASTIISVPRAETFSPEKNVSADVFQKSPSDITCLQNNHAVDSRNENAKHVSYNFGGALKSKKAVGGGDVEKNQDYVTKIVGYESAIPEFDKGKEHQDAINVKQMLDLPDNTEKSSTRLDAPKSAVTKTDEGKSKISQSMAVATEQFGGARKLPDIKSIRKSCVVASPFSDTIQSPTTERSDTPCSSRNCDGTTKADPDEITQTCDAKSRRRVSATKRRMSKSPRGNERNSGTKDRLVKAMATASAKSNGTSKSPRNIQNATTVRKQQRLIQSARSYKDKLNASDTLKNSHSTSSLLDKHKHLSIKQQRVHGNLDKKNEVTKSVPASSAKESNSFSSTDTTTSDAMDSRLKTHRGRRTDHDRSKSGVKSKTNRDSPQPNLGPSHDAQTHVHPSVRIEPKPPPTQNHTTRTHGQASESQCMSRRAAKLPSIDVGQQKDLMLRTSCITNGSSAGHTPYPSSSKASSYCNSPPHATPTKSDDSAESILTEDEKSQSSYTAISCRQSVSNCESSSQVMPGTDRSSSLTRTVSVAAVETIRSASMRESRKHSATPSRLPIPTSGQTVKLPAIKGCKLDDPLIRTASWITNVSSVGHTPYPLSPSVSSAGSKSPSLSTSKHFTSKIPTARSRSQVKDDLRPSRSIPRTPSTKREKTTPVSDRTSIDSQTTGGRDTKRASYTVGFSSSGKSSACTGSTAASSSVSTSGSSIPKAYAPRPPSSINSSRSSSRNSWESSTASSASRILSGRRTYVIPVSPSEYQKILPLPTIHGTTPVSVLPENGHRISSSSDGSDVEYIEVTPATTASHSKRSNRKSAVKTVFSERTIATPFTWPMTRARLDDYCAAKEDDGSSTSTIYSLRGASQASLIDDGLVFMSSASSCGTSSVDLDIPMSPDSVCSTTSVVLVPDNGSVHEEAGG